MTVPESDNTTKTVPGGEDEAPEQPLDLKVAIDETSACERHVTVTVSRADVDRYCDNAFSEMMPTATVPGFRDGRAARKLVEHRFRKEVLDQVKGSLVVDSMAQVSDEQDFKAIGEPDFDIDAVEVPDDGPMTFEFDLEVRPEFEMPQWKGLVVERPVREFGEKEIDAGVHKILARYGQLVPCDRPARRGDFVTVGMATFEDDEEVASIEETVVRVADVLSFQDGRLDTFGQLINGASVGDVRQGDVKVSGDAPNESLRGKTVQVRFSLLDVKELKLPELADAFLDEMGGFESEAELRDAIRQDLERQLSYRQAQQIRRQISAALTSAADWQLPPGLLKRQSARELDRAVLELRRSGFSDAEIQARENDLRQNSAASTEAALKEHFILERIAEEEEVDVDSADYEDEIRLIAAQSSESVRRVRAQLEKRGLMDVLRNQIIERKVIDVVRSHAKLKDRPLKEDEADVEAIDAAVGGADEEPPIPEVKQGGKKAAEET